MADRIDLIHSYSKQGKGPGNKGSSSSKPSFVAMVYPNDHGYGKKRKRSKISTAVKKPSETAEDAEEDLFPEALEVIDSYKKTKWTQPEKDFVISYVDKHPLTHSLAYWSKMAKELNKKFSRSRTGSTCRIFYKRIAAELKSAPSKTVNTSSQTDSVFPFLPQLKSPERRLQTEDKGTKQSTGTDLKAGSKHKSLDPKQKKKLLSVINSSDMDSLVQCIYSCDVLKERLWEVFLKEIQ